MLAARAIALGRLFFFHSYRPSYVLFFVTSRCEANCSHCFYWQQRNNVTDELSLQQIEKFVQQCGPVLQVTLTGGSPELRQDLPEIAGLFWKYCRPLNMTLCSNGNNPYKLLGDVKTIYQHFPDCKLTVDISLDGLFDEHDRLRGIAGLFDNVIDSYRHLHDLQKKHKNLRLGCGVCVTGLNKQTALTTARWAIDNLPIDNLTPILVRGEPQDPQALNTDSSVFMQIADDVERRLRSGAFKGYASFSRIVNRKDIIQKKLIRYIYENHQSPIRCSAARETVVVYPDGTVGGCELRKEVLGSLPQVNMDIAAIWRNRQAMLFRDKIRNEKCSCWHQCFLSPTIVKSPTLWLSPKAL